MLCYYCNVIGDFNAQNSKWWNGDSTNLQGTELAELATQLVWSASLMGLLAFLQICDFWFNFHYGNKFCYQLGSSSFTISEMSSPNNFCKSEFRYNFFFLRRIWNFSVANVNAIREAVNSVDWDKVFNSLNNDERVKFLTKCVLNFIYNFAPNKVITIRS